MTQLLIGIETTYSAAVLAHDLVCGRFVALNSGTLTELRVYSSASGNVKAGVYSDNASAPDTLLSVNNSGVACSASQWNAVAIPSLSITKDTYYWLAGLADISGVIRRTTAGGTTDYKTGYGYASGLPSPAGTGYIPTAWQLAIVGYGDPVSGAGLLLGIGF